MRSFVLRMMSAALALVALGAVASAPAGAEEVAGTTCSSDSGLATLSPGLGEVAEIQNISVKGTLRGCTGSTGTTANYVAHLKTDKPITCASVSGEAQTAEGSVVIKWGKGHGNSLGTLSLSGSVAGGFSLSGSLTSGPFAGGSISSTITGTPHFTGTGAPCSKKNRLKALAVTGASAFAIS
jgi:hypothetical protein